MFELALQLVHTSSVIFQSLFFCHMYNAINAQHYIVVGASSHLLLQHIYNLETLITLKIRTRHVVASGGGGSLVLTTLTTDY